MQLRHQVICFQSEINVGSILGIVIIIIIIGFLVRVILQMPRMRCHDSMETIKCKALSKLRKNYSISSFDFSIEKLENQIIFE